MECSNGCAVVERSPELCFIRSPSSVYGKHLYHSWSSKNLSFVFVFVFVFCFFLWQHADHTASFFALTCTTITETCMALHQWNVTMNLQHLPKNGQINKPQKAICTIQNGRTNSPRAFRGKDGGGKEWTKWKEPYLVQ